MQELRRIGKGSRNAWWAQFEIDSRVPREIPRPAGENAGDSGMTLRPVFEVSHYRF
jgi:hypothetical protein